MSFPVTEKKHKRRDDVVHAVCLAERLCILYFVMGFLYVVSRAWFVYWTYRGLDIVELHAPHVHIRCAEYMRLYA